MAWLLDDRNRDEFLRECKNAVLYEGDYSLFRQSDPFRLIVENSPLKSGFEYYHCIQNEFPWLNDYMDKFQKSDKIGGPITYDIGGYKISPSTLRYVKTLGDLAKFFGSLDDMNIIEIGGGYGGLCKVVYDVYNPNSYVIYDLPEVSMLQAKFLNEFGIQLSLVYDKIDLLIAMYSWSELDEEMQKTYIKHVISKAKNCYIMLNYNMEKSYKLLCDAFPNASITDYNLFYDDNNTEYAPYNRFIIIKTEE